jgi:hypothetical protein
MKRAGVEFEVINHGWEHQQYFQGCGVSFTSYTHVATGAGMTAREAYEDAVEQLHSYPGMPDGFHFPKCPRNVRSGVVPADCRGEDSEIYYYVSVRVRMPEEAACPPSL